jgi:lipoprotein-anchoring transpeptidase ErfK/SrfK
LKIFVKKCNVRNINHQNEFIVQFMRKFYGKSGEIMHSKNIIIASLYLLPLGVALMSAPTLAASQSAQKPSWEVSPTNTVTNTPAVSVNLPNESTAPQTASPQAVKVPLGNQTATPVAPTNIEPNTNENAVTTPKPIKKPERLVAKVSLKKQFMTISLDGEMIYKWVVSTGKKDFETPPGSYTGQRKYTMWRSRTYDNAPMPFAVFFFDGYAVHGTTALRALGTPASHGCVRVTTPNAKIFYELVDEVGLRQTNVQILDN